MYDVLCVNSTDCVLSFLSSFLFAGIVWVIFSFGVSLLRLFALQLDDPMTIIGWFTNNLTSPDQVNALKLRLALLASD